jgi:hypothetical protein
MLRLTSFMANNNSFDSTLPIQLRFHTNLRSLDLTFNRFLGSLASLPRNVTSCVVQVAADSNCFVRGAENHSYLVVSLTSFHILALQHSRCPRLWTLHNSAVHAGSDSGSTANANACTNDASANACTNDAGANSGADDSRSDAVANNSSADADSNTSTDACANAIANHSSANAVADHSSAHSSCVNKSDSGATTNANARATTNANTSHDAQSNSKSRCDDEPVHAADTTANTIANAVDDNRSHHNHNHHHHHHHNDRFVCTDGHD